MRRRTLVRLALGAGALGALGGGERFFVARFARPAEAEGPLSPAAQALLDEAWRGLEPAKVLDVHAHVVGMGTGGTGAFVNPRMVDALGHPLQYTRFEIYCRAACIDDLSRADQQYVERLVAHVRAQPRHGRLTLLPFDRVYREDGTPDLEATELSAPNDYALELARRHPDCFVAAASVHPYRPDALDELDRVAAKGAVLIKWLPNAQRIDPASARCDRFYDRLSALGLPLLTHAGEEHAVDSTAQDWGNPLRLRRALDHGAKVIMAHCAGLGACEDLDAPGQQKPLAPSFDLLLRMLDDPRHRALLYADISALTQANRCDKLPALLRRTDLHERLVYGTDYPLAAINGLVRTGALVDLGLLTPEKRDALNELDRHNPLAFDLALKRSLTLRENGTEKRFAPSVFQLRPELLPRVRAAPG